MANFYVTDRKYNLIDVVSTDGNTDIKATSVSDIQSIEESTRTFEATMFFEDDYFKLAKKLTQIGNYILYKDREEKSVFITIESREINATDGLVMITGRDASIDLINEIVGAYVPDKSYTIAEYILRFTSDSGFEIGENAIPDKKLKLEEWTSESTALERILSVATRFDVELYFSFEINGLDVVKLYINIVEKRGKDENITLYANKEIESITLKEDSFDLFTAIKPIGAIPEGKETPINLNSYKYTDPDGRYVLSGGILRDNQVVQEWSRLLSNENTNPTTAHITRYKEYDTEDQAKLFTMAMTDLKKYAQLNVNYDVAFYEFPTTVSIGDTINIVDEDKEIYLSARVLTLTYDYVTDTAEATIGDYLIKESGISQELENLASSMKDKFANVNENLNGKAVIVKSDTAPEPNENTIWIDTSNPQTPIKTYDPETGEWLVSTGEAGKDGIAGKDGLGVLSTVITYAISASGTTTPTGGWTAQVPTLEKGKYLWTKTQWTYTDGSTENGYTVSYIAKDGNDGTDGIAGKDGVGITNTLIQYVGSTSGTTTPTSGWSTTIPTVAEGNFLWTRTTWTYTDNTSEMGYSVAKMGAKGDKGDTGAKGSDGIAGKDGVGIKETIIRYAGSSNGTTAPTSGWQSTVPVVAGGSFLWTRTTWTYTDNTSEIGYSVARIGADGNNGSDGIAGKDGTGITSTTITYVGSTSGTTKPTTGWTASIPTVADGNFLWTKTVWLYTDDTSETGYSVSKMGAKGSDGKDGVAGKDGVGIKSTTIQYASSTSGVTAPTTGWQTNVPTVSAGNYLWTKNTWTYTDNTTEIGYAVSRIGADGNNGTDGIAGKDGTGIKATSIQYAGSTSGTTPPTTGWTASVPTVASGSYLWTKTTWSYTDNTSETGYSVSKMGETGAKGDTGASATSYWITPSVNTIQISATKVLNPTTVTFTGYSKTGTANAGLYAGRFNILTSVDGIVYSSKYSSSANQSAYTYTVPADVKFIKARMYQAGSTSVLVDEQTIPIIESAEGLEIGGRNYITDTARVRSINGNGGTNQTQASTSFYFSLPLKDFAKVGDTFTFSTTAEISGSGFAGSFFPQTAFNAWVSLTPVINVTKAETININRTLTITQEMLDVPITVIRIRCDNVPATVKIDFTKVMLSKGNKVLDWVPALEDAKLYTAWSNNPNGKDMIRVYPNENLLVRTGEFTEKIIGTAGGIDPYAGNNTSAVLIPVTAGDTLYMTQSTYNAQQGFRWRWLDSNKVYIANSRGANVSNKQFTVTAPTGASYFQASYSTLGENKVERGSYSIMTPSPQDDPIKAEMAYIGYSPKDSNDPKDYAWSENPKAKGTFKRWANDPNGLVDFTRTYPNENLITNSKMLTDYSASVWTRKVTDIEGFYMLDISTTNNTSWQESRVLLSPEYGSLTGQVTVSFEYKNSVRDLLWTNIGAYNGDSRLKEIDNVSVDNNPVYVCTVLSNGWTKAVGVFDVSNLANVSANAYWLQFKKVSTKSGDISVRKVKVETGSNPNAIYTSSSEEDSLLAIPQYVGIGAKDTMNPADFVWTVSPEYTQAKTDVGLDSKVDDETFNDAQDHLNEQIDSKASSDELQALAELTDNLKESYDGFMSDGGKYEADLQALESRATGLLLDLEDKVLDLDFLKTYFRIGEEGMLIGKSDSQIQMLLNNDRLSFMMNGNEIAYFSNGSFKINRGMVMSDLQIGSHKFTKISSKMTVIQFVPE